MNLWTVGVYGVDESETQQERPRDKGDAAGRTFGCLGYFHNSPPKFVDWGTFPSENILIVSNQQSDISNNRPESQSKRPQLHEQAIESEPLGGKALTLTSWMTQAKNSKCSSAGCPRS